MNDVLLTLQGVNRASAFDAWAGVEIVSAGDGRCELALAARADLLQQAGFLHAGVQAALIDRACGFAAASVAGPVATAQFSVRCYKPARGERFLARAEVVRRGKRQIFTEARLFAVDEGAEILVAAGDALLAVTA
jgi:uncharacterized protein (TIGR00369 family)